MSEASHASIAQYQVGVFDGEDLTTKCQSLTRIQAILSCLIAGDKTWPSSRSRNLNSEVGRCTKRLIALEDAFRRRNRRGQDNQTTTSRWVFEYRSILENLKPVSPLLEAMGPTPPSIEIVATAFSCRKMLAVV